MALRPTKISKLTEAILVRECSVEGPDGAVHPLIMTIYRPRLVAEQTVEGALRFECPYFDETLSLDGGDDLQAITFLLSIGQVMLEHFAARGFEIWWERRGDRNFFDFWSYKEKPAEFALKSAFHWPALEAFEKANKGKFLTPSHRIAVDSERPCVQVYEVRPDGSDVVGAMVTPDKIASMTTDELCHEIGRTVLFSSREGRRLLGLGPTEDQIRADVEARKNDA